MGQLRPYRTRSNAFDKRIPAGENFVDVHATLLNALTTITEYDVLFGLGNLKSTIVAVRKFMLPFKGIATKRGAFVLLDKDIQEILDERATQHGIIN